MRQLQAAESGIFYMTPETVDELGLHLKKHIAEAKSLFERGVNANANTNTSPATNALPAPTTTDSLAYHNSQPVFPLNTSTSPLVSMNRPTQPGQLSQDSRIPITKPAESTDSLFTFEALNDTAQPKETPVIETNLLRPKDDNKDDKSDDFNFYFDLESPILKKRGLSEENINEAKRSRMFSKDIDLPLSYGDSPWSEFEEQGCITESIPTGTRLFYNGWTIFVSLDKTLTLEQGSEDIRLQIENCKGRGERYREILRALIPPAV